MTHKEIELQVEEHQVVLTMAERIVKIRREYISLLRRMQSDQPELPATKDKFDKPPEIETATTDAPIVYTPGNAYNFNGPDKESPIDPPIDVPDKVTVNMIVEAAQEIAKKRDVKILHKVCKEFGLQKLTAASEEKMPSVYVRLQGILNE